MREHEVEDVGSPHPLIAIPNVSEGRDPTLVHDLSTALEEGGSRVLDIHSDRVHNRSVFTIVGSDEDLIASTARLARASRAIDLTTHAGVHPRVGTLDVCPFVAVEGDLKRAARVAERACQAIWEEARLPVYLYGAAARREETRSLPEIRRGGLPALIQRARGGLPPDCGHPEIEATRGVVCVGARGPLVAFNVSISGDGDTARRLASAIRTGGGGPPGVQALGWTISPREAQISMNLVLPDETGIDQAFDAVAHRARQEGVDVIGCEIIGLPLERHLPHPQREAARLLIKPGRSLESALRS